VTQDPPEYVVAAMCRGKESFASPKLARDVAKRRQRRGQPVESYRCKVCDQWHVGGRAESNAALRRKAAMAAPAPRRCLTELEAWDGDVSFGDGE